MTAKDEILKRISSSSASGSSGATLQGVRGKPPAESPRTQSQIVDQFIEYASEYKAYVLRTTGEELPDVIDARLKQRGSEKVVIPPDFPQRLLPPGLDATPDDIFDGQALDAFDASITAAAVGIAETGTVVLDAGPGQGRRALTLVPDHHICILLEDRIVDSVLQAVDRLKESVKAGLPLTFISGPSATSDIELQRVEGVHGARKLDILVVSG